MPLDIQVHDFEGVFLDEFAALLDVFAHECRENILGGDGILETDFEERARLGVHGGLPKLVGVHLAEALETRDGEFLFRVFENIAENAEGVVLRHFVAIVRDGERRLIVVANGLAKRAEALVFRRGGEGPVDAALGTVCENNFVQAVFFVERELGFELQLGFFDFLHQLLEFLLLREVDLLVEFAFGKEFDEPGIAQAARQLRGDLLVLLNIEEELREDAAFEGFAALAFHYVLLRCALHQFAGELSLVADVPVHFPALDAIERRLGDVNMALFDEFAHVAEEKCKEQRANVTAVDVGVGHENDLVVAELGGVEIVLADAGAEGGDDGADFFVAEHLVVTRFLDVEDFAFERQDCLVLAVAALLCGAARGFALNDKQFAARGVAFLAVSEFSRKARGIERGFAAGQLASLARGFARTGSVNALADDLSRDGRMLVEVFAKLLVDQRLDEALDVAIELALGLPLELGLGQLDADDGDEAFADVVAGDGDFVLLLFQHAERAGVIIDRARQGGTEAGEMRAAVHGIDGVGEAKNVFGVAVVVLERDFHFDGVALAFHVNRRIVESFLATVEVLDEFGDAAGEAKLGLFARTGALVLESDF